MHASKRKDCKMPGCNPAFNEDDLQELLNRLCNMELTATEVAYWTGCSKMVAYRRIRTLEERGYKFQKRKVKNFGCPGPSAIAYRLKKTSASPFFLDRTRAKSQSARR